MTVEPQIVINGVPLTNAQAMMVRCAIEGFSFELMNNGLGDDEHGKTMVKLYMQRIEEVRPIMYSNNQHYQKSNEIMTPFDYGYDHYLNGGKLDYEPLNNPADDEYRAGWKQAQEDYTL